MRLAHGSRSPREQQRGRGEQGRARLPATRRTSASILPGRDQQARAFGYSHLAPGRLARQNRCPQREGDRVTFGCVVALAIACLFGSGCLFDGGSSIAPKAQVNAATLCSSTPLSGGGCPACSTPDGALCRDQWYSSALRCSSDAQCGAP